MLFRNATVFTGSEFLPNASVRVENGRIAELNAHPPAQAEGVDLAGDYLVPGFVDLQVYGGSAQFLNASPTADTVRHILTTHQHSGTTSIVPTLFSASLPVMVQAAEAVRMVMAEQPFSVLGMHAEGPYINPEKRGVHPLAAIRQPAPAELSDLFTQYGDVLLMMTLAPEVFPASERASLLKSKPNRLLLAIGHSNATYAEATLALNNGVSLATHLYNAMRAFESREPGVLGAIFDHSTIRSSIVADGLHCDPVAVRMAHRLLGDRLFLISDALLVAPAQIRVDLDQDTLIRYENGRLTNQYGQLAGSAITLLDAVRFCVDQVGIPLSNVLRMASTIPADIVGFGHQLGNIKPGYIANLVRLDAQLQLKGVWAQGKQVA